MGGRNLLWARGKRPDPSAVTEQLLPHRGYAEVFSQGPRSVYESDGSRCTRCGSEMALSETGAHRYHAQKDDSQLKPKTKGANNERSHYPSWSGDRFGQHLFICSSCRDGKARSLKLPGPTGATVWSPPPVESWTMSNGINVWFLEAKQAPLITLQLITAHGSDTDEVGKAGTADFMVDMLDEGAGSRDALALSDAFQLIATDYSGDAGLDGITFSLNMLADQLDSSLALLADVVRRPTFPAKEFERRKLSDWRVH